MDSFRTQVKILEVVIKKKDIIFLKFILNNCFSMNSKNVTNVPLRGKSG